jgi:hypothetical protein
MKKNFTKKIVLASLITFGLFTVAKAQSDDQSAYDDQYPQQQQQQQPQQQQQYVQPQQQQYTQPQQQYVQPQYTQPADPAYAQSFDYYPDANVYYDNTSNQYIYNNDGAWLTVNVLPSWISLYGSPCYRVYHRGPQVWLDNAIHFRTFYRGGGYRPVGGGYRPVVYGGYRTGGWNGRQNFYHANRSSFNNRGFNYNRGGGGGFHGGGFRGGHRR